jgi:hypothetical protein
LTIDYLDPLCPAVTDGAPALLRTVELLLPQHDDGRHP